MSSSSSVDLGGSFSGSDTEKRSLLTKATNLVFLAVFLVAAVFLAVALISYQKIDPGFSHTSNVSDIRNICGFVGAWTADFLYLLFGWGAWLLVIAAFALVIANWRAVLDKPSLSHIPSGVRLFSFCCFLLSLCTLFFLRLHSLSGPLPGTSGGAIGSAIGTELLFTVGLSWATAVTGLVVALSASYFFGFSWLSLMEKIGRSLEVFVMRLRKNREDKADIQEGIEQRKMREQRLSKQLEQGNQEQAATEQNADSTVITPVAVNPTAVEPLKEVQKPEPIRKLEDIPTPEPAQILPINTDPIEISPESFAPTASIVDEDDMEEDVGEDNELIIEEPPVVEPAGPTLFNQESGYVLPEVGLLDNPPHDRPQADPDELRLTGERIEHILSNYRIKAKVIGAMPGPIITQFKIKPGEGVRSEKFVKVAKDLARGLGQTSVRVIENLREVDCLGLEVPNSGSSIQNIYLREIIGSPVFQNHDSKLALALGKDVAGVPIVMDLAKAPHLLVAGTTGSGKSVGVNAMILSMIYRNTPEELRLILIDPKEVEFSPYENIPHLLTPVVTDMMKAAHALDWAVREMDKRYKLMKEVSREGGVVRNFEGFNEKIERAQREGKPILNPFSMNPDNPEPLKKFYYIVIIVDELADLLMTHGKQVSVSIARLTQKARAAGMHLILATQRPSTDIVTPLIKTNCPTRISFQVANRFDSQTILGDSGAEDLLGRGDMFFMSPGKPLQRVHGANVTDKEIEAVTNFAKAQREPDYIDGVTEGAETSEGDEEQAAPKGPTGGEQDALYDNAVNIVLHSGTASISHLQRKLGVGYNRAAKLIEAMEEAGLVSAPQGPAKQRKVIANLPEDL